MQYSGCVSCRQAVCDPYKQLDNVFPFPSCSHCPFFDRAAIDELGYQIRPSVELADTMNRENVRVVERGCHFGLALESPSRRAVRPTVGNDFDGDSAIELRID